MKGKFLIFLIMMFMLAGGTLAQTSWLDSPLTNWNNSLSIPIAPRNQDTTAITRCRDLVRNPESIADRALTRAGWTLFGAAQVYGNAIVINGMAGVDGMCRPMRFNTFVFVSNRFAGTLSPTLMDARTDGALNIAMLRSATAIAADFDRYTSNDALCCPSQTSEVIYKIQSGRVLATEVNTEANCQTSNNEEPEQVEEGVVRGTVTYRQRIALQRNSTITVRLVDISQTNAPSITIAEQRIDTGTRQVPIPFEIKFNPNRINQNRRYAIQAEISTNGRTIFTTDRVYSVLTQGNPNNVDLTLVAIGSIGNNQSTNSSGSIRGMVNLTPRTALPANSTLLVRLVDNSVTNSTEVIAEDSFNVNSQQSSIPFELRYELNRIDSRRSYALEAEIRTSDSRVSYKTDRAYNVLTRGNPTNNIDLFLDQVAGNIPSNVITGQNISLSKLGTGSYQIEGRGNEFLLRGTVTVKADGTAEVGITRFNGTIIFTGKLTYLDSNIMRITVESSGNANAGGEIEISYTNRQINTIVSNNLTIDGQKAAIKF